MVLPKMIIRYICKTIHNKNVKIYVTYLLNIGGIDQHNEFKLLKYIINTCKFIK